VSGATLADWEAVPAPYSAHLIAGKLHVLPRPSPGHALAATSLTDELVGPFQKGRGGPGGWWILAEVDVRLGQDVVAPDLAGWQRTRMPVVPRGRPVLVAPDWVCEVISPGTEVFDRGTKAPWYAAAGVSWLWFVDPEEQLLEVHQNDAGTFRQLRRWQGNVEVTAPPFEPVSWPLGALWG
jgi:Uma2 family endonuclease